MEGEDKHEMNTRNMSDYIEMLPQTEWFPEF
jgi:hypothetical protein